MISNWISSKFYRFTTWPFLPIHQISTGYRYFKSFGARSKGFIYDTWPFRRFKTFQFQIKSVVWQDNGSLAKYWNIPKIKDTPSSWKRCFSQVRYQYNNLLKILYIKSISHCFQYYQRRRYIANIGNWGSFGISLQYR